MSGGLTQIPPEQGMSSKIRMGDWCGRYWLYTLRFCWPSNIQVEKHSSDENIESNHQGSDIVDKCTCGEAYMWRLTSLLVVTLLKFTLKPFAFSKSYPFLCNASRHLYSHLVVEMQTLHGHSTQSGLGPVTLLQTQVTDEHAICVACSKTRVGNFGTFRKDCVVAANFLPKLESFNWWMSSGILSANCGHSSFTFWNCKTITPLVILVSNHIWPMHFHLSMLPTKSLSWNTGLLPQDGESQELCVHYQSSCPEPFTNHMKTQFVHSRM